MPDENISSSDQYLKPPRLHFLYHEVKPFPSKFSYTLETIAFERHLDFIAQVGEQPHPSVSVELTFDDGHASDFEFVLPILNARRLTARFFITTGWTGTRPGYMGWREVRCLSDAGHRIGSHGWSHALLTRCSERELHAELRESRSELEDKLGIPITTMSLPGGRYNKRVLSACSEAGYTKVYTSVPRVEQDATEFVVGRVNMNSNMTIDCVARLVQPGSGELARLQSRYRIKEMGQRVLGDWMYEKIWHVLIGRGQANRVETSALNER
jgi:peptidoglycan/xylan/chitin deacetylase (PgdA/CDA1 family)